MPVGVVAIPRPGMDARPPGPTDAAESGSDTFGAKRGVQSRIPLGNSAARTVIARPGGTGAEFPKPLIPSRRHGRSGSHPQLLDHRPHRPRQVDAGRPHPRADPHRRPAIDARPGARLDGARARARDHDQGAGGAGVLRSRRWSGVSAAPDRHARPRRLHLRGVAVAGRVRGRAARGRRQPGGRGADGREHLSGDRLGARADPLPEQGRPPRCRARARGRGGRGAPRRAR